MDCGHSSEGCFHPSLINPDSELLAVSWSVGGHPMPILGEGRGWEERGGACLFPNIFFSSAITPRD